MESVHDPGRCLTRRDRRSPAESPGGSGIPPRQRYLFLWGPLVAAGSVLNQAFPNQSAVIWYGIDTAGFICDCFEPLPRWDGGCVDWRFVATFFILLAYGIAWSYLLAPAGHDRIAVFWATLMMMPYVTAGLWWGPLFAVCGLVAPTAKRVILPRFVSLIIDSPLIILEKWVVALCGGSIEIFNHI